MSKKLSELFNIHRNYFLLVLVVVFIGIRLINLPQVVNFGSDAGRDFLVVWHIYTTHHPVLIGPPSEYTVNGRQFFFGPAPYYLILPALLIGDWSPLFVSYFLIALNLVILILSLNIIDKSVKEKFVVYAFACFCTVTPFFVSYSKSYWNPYFMLPVSTLLVALLVNNRMQKNTIWVSFLLGFLFGFGLQLHYSFILAIIISCLWLFLNKKITLPSVALLVGGFIVGFFPLILFELRNHFYNLQTLLLVFTSANGLHSGFIFNPFYLISLLPFLFYFLSVFLAKVSLQYRKLVYLFFVAYLLWSVYSIFSIHNSQLPYTVLLQIAHHIENEKPTSFNIVDQLSGDNRALALRYLLTVSGDTPDGVTQYPKARTLYIYSKVSLKDLLKDPVWEIKSFLPAKTVKTVKITDGVFLYKLEK